MDRGKPTLETMPIEIQVEILRHLLRRNDPIKLCPFDYKIGQKWEFGSLAILRTSRHLSDVSLGILYGDNSFKLLKKVHTVQGNLFPCLYEREIENPRWSTLKNMPRDVTWYASSVDCLDSLSQTRPGQERLRSVSVEMSYHMIVVFYKGLIPQILKRLRALQSLKLIIKKKAWTWASFDPMSTDRGKDIHDFDCEFLDLIKTQLGHIRKITMTTMTKYGKADDAEIGPCPWFLEQLEKRNRAWTPQSSARKSIREDYLRHNNIGPIGSNVSVKFDTVNGKPERVTEKRDRLINPSSHKPRDAFH